MHPKISAAALGAATMAILSGAAWAGPLDSSYESTVRSGSSVVVDRAVFLNADCRPHAGTRIEIVSPPAHGNVHSANIVEYSFRSPDPRWLKCDGKRVAKIALFYRPKVGFVGQDHLIARRHYPDGSAPIVDTITVHVEK